MAEAARRVEEADWKLAGVRPGAVVADIGCGPGAVLKLLAEAIGAGGSVVGVDADQNAVDLAAAEVADLAHAGVQLGSADNSGLKTNTYDVVMCRHVLAHNAGTEQAIVDHLTTLLKPGGCAYLADVDVVGDVYDPPLPRDLVDLGERYRQLHHEGGGDLRTGSRLGSLLTDAGLDVLAFHQSRSRIALPRGIRGPEWAAREALVSAGLASPADVSRWDDAYRRLDDQVELPSIVAPICIAVGRKPNRNRPHRRIAH